jgi:uncharacterized protein (UPF0264 family)
MSKRAVRDLSALIEHLENERLEKSWTALAKEYGLYPAIMWRIVNEEYEPKRPDIRKKLGLPQVIRVPIQRGKNGRFEPIEQGEET